MPDAHLRGYGVGPLLVHEVSVRIVTDAFHFPSSPLRLLTAAAGGLACLQGITNGAALPARTGGPYGTEAGLTFKHDVLPGLQGCINGHGMVALPAERVIAGCLAQTAGEVCSAGDDPGCATVAGRSLVVAGDDSAALVPSRSRRIMAHSIGQRALLDEPNIERMQQLVPVVQRRMGSTFEVGALPFTADNLRALIDERNDAYLDTLCSAGMHLHATAAKIADELFQWQPEVMDAQRRADFAVWLDAHYPKPGATRMSPEQLTRILKDLAAFLNATYGLHQ